MNKGTTLTSHPASRDLLAEDGRHANPKVLMQHLVDADARSGSSGLAYIAEHTRAADLTERADDLDERGALYHLCAQRGVLLEVTAGPRITEPVIRCANGAGSLSYFVPAMWPLADAAKRFPEALSRWNADHTPAADDSDLHRLFRDATYRAHMKAAPQGFDAANAASDAQHRLHLLTAVQAHAQHWGSGHGRILEEEYAEQLTAAAEVLITEAVRVSTAGTQTNDHTVSARLHRAIDRAQAAHLVEIAPEVHTPDTAYSNERFGTASDAMADAMAFSASPRRMADGLTGCLSMVITEAGAPAPSSAPGYVPPTDWEGVESVTCQGERGAILKACLFTPTWEGKPEGPTRLSVYGEPNSEGELDASGATKLIADLEALLPKLRGMRDALAAQDAR